MAKNSITDFDNTAANNTDIQSVNIDENCPASGINNAIRELMADLADVNDGTVALTSPKFDSIKDGNIKPPDASGTDVAGTATTIKGGAGTGTGAGGSIIFQTADGGSTGSSVNAHATAMTITDDGNINFTGSIKDSAGTNTALTISSSGQVSMPNTVEIDHWRLTTNFTTDDATITGWERNDDATFAYAGTGMSESSGVFTFPKTGLYKVILEAEIFNSTTDSNVEINVYVSSDSGSTYDRRAQMKVSGTASDTDTVGGASRSIIVNVTDASTFRYKLVTDTLGSGSAIVGNTNNDRTSILFERIADSQ